MVTAHRNERGRERGFTLIELMAVVALVALLATLAAPSMSRLIASQRTKTAAGDLHLALMKARSEALKRNGNVSVLPQAGGWGGGWVVSSAAGQQIDVYAVRGVSVATAVASVVYGPTGRVIGATRSSFTVRASAVANVAKCVSVELSGRPYMKDGVCE